MSVPASRGFVSSVHAFCIAHDLIGRHARIVVGVSGGPDSMALLRALLELSATLDLTLTVAHLDHGLRRASRRDAQFVRETSAGLALPFQTARVEVTRLAKRRKISIEEAGRDARYAFLARAAVQTKSRLVAVGHQQDDQAETVLLRLLRGSSGTGLSGMAPARPLSPGVTLIRPLLDRSRADVESYLNWRGVNTLTDSTNADPGFTRNRVRRELLPLLERKFNPRVREALARAANVLAEDDAALEAQARSIRLPPNIQELRRLPLAVRRRALRHAAIRGGADPRRLTQAHLDALIRLVATGSGSTDLPNVRALVERRAIKFC